jgi:Coiled-coil domain containing 32
MIDISSESRLNKIKKDPSILKQLKEKREECLNNLLNTSLNYNTERDFELEEEVKSHDIIRHLIPAQAQTAGEVAHLIQHDILDQQKQESEEVEESPATN